MKPGDRIKLIKSLAKRLSDEEWSDVDLTLRQFNIPWSRNWGYSDKYKYALHHLEESDSIGWRA
jgi:hypothetical protein